MSPFDSDQIEIGTPAVVMFYCDALLCSKVAQVGTLHEQKSSFEVSFASGPFKKAKDACQLHITAFLDGK